MREAQEVRIARSHRRVSVAPCPWLVRIVHSTRFVRTCQWQEITTLRRQTSWYYRCSTYCAMRLFGVLLVIAGCADPIPTLVPDGPGSDGPPGVGGLVVSWNADPGLPGTISDKIIVTE